MSIVGVICLGLLVDIVLPKGNVSKYVKGAFSLVVVAVIIAPLPSIFNSEWKIDFDINKFQVDSQFVESTLAKWSKQSSDDVEEYLFKRGYKASVSITFKDEELNKIESVRVFVELANFKEEVWKNVLDSVKDEVVEHFLLEEKKVFVEPL